MISDDELRRIMPNCPQAKRELYLPHLQAAMTEFGITTYLREAAFLAQLAHESGEFRWMEEIASGAAYEGRRDLGNTQPGDGKRYKGRGPIQLTGRANYRRYGQLLGLDLEGNPQQASTPQVGFRIAALYWQSNGLNELADRQEFRTITKRINGGFNGLADRIKYYDRAKAALSRDDAGGLTRGLPGAGTRSVPPAGGPSVPPNLSRGILPGEEGGEGGAKKAAGGAKKAAAKKSGAKKAAKKGGATKSAGKGGAKKGSAKKGGAKKGSAKTGGAKGGSKKGGSKKGGASKGGSKKGGGAKGGGAKGGGAKKGSAKKGGAKKGGSKKGGSKKGGAKGRR